ncbi:unnamed protein product [Coffea canephora]|uniref:NB-ARC domain-containing protein n=1 Tax=Coffea canephora TaxID=49390 RepID=A0A068U8N8_COFCA|nr:unnamed protein product [Coffea canephora]
MGGQGKTTLAQLVLKNESIMKYFDEKFWVCVSDNFRVERLLNHMLQSLGEKNAETTTREAFRMYKPKKLYVVDHLYCIFDKNKINIIQRIQITCMFIFLT